MIIRLQWEEPDYGDCLYDVKLSQQEVDDLIAYLKSSAGAEYGITIPSVTVVKKTHRDVEKVTVQELADSLRYSTGESIFSTDFNIFHSFGVDRS